MAAETAEQAYSVFEALFRALKASPAEISREIYPLLLRAALHPLLVAVRRDPLASIDGEFVSLDARVNALIDEFALLSDADALLRDFPADDLWEIGDLPENAARLESAGEVGIIGGALYLPALGRAQHCGIRAYCVPGNDPRRIGWAPPLAVRQVGSDIQASAAKSQNAALQYLVSIGALPPGALPGVVYFDVCGTNLTDEMLVATAGNSLDLPLFLVFLSAFTRIPISAKFGATGALRRMETREEPQLVSVTHVREKAEAFGPGLSGNGGTFIAPRDSWERDCHEMGITSVTSIAEAIDFAFDGKLSVMPTRTIPREDNDKPANTNQSVLLTGIIDDFSGNALSTVDASIWRRIATQTIERTGGICLPMRSAEREFVFGIQARFDSVDCALAAALAIIDALRCVPWLEAPRPLTFDTVIPGFGLHCAPHPEASYSVLADATRQSLRIAEVANPAQVLLSASAYDRLTDREINDISIVACKTQRLRDLAPPVSLWQAKPTRGGAIVTAAPELPLRSLDSVAHNLPFHLTPTFGREAEIGAVRRLLVAQTRVPRVTTLTGVGGVGKSRVALEAAARSVADFPDGIWLVRIDDSVRTPNDIAQLISDAMQVTVSGANEPAGAVKALAEALTGQRLLFILDGCESGSVNAAVSQFVSDFFTLASATLLVTARTPLRAPEENVVPIGPIATVARSAAGLSSNDFEEAFSAPAIELFQNRALQLNPAFALIEAKEREIVWEICRQAEGLPLAIELAAAQVGSLSLAEIAGRLSSFHNTEGTRRSAMPRTIEWAFALLDPDDQNLLSALAVFQDGFSADAASEIAHHYQLDSDAVLRLEERSLIRQRRDDRGRYDLHSLVRQFAYRQLSLSGQENEARRLHAEHFARFAARYGADEPNTDREREFYDRLEPELGNLRATVEFLRTNDPAKVPALVVNLSNFLRYRGHLLEWYEWLRLAQRLLAGQPGQTSPLGAKLHLYHAAMFFDRNSLDDSERHIDEALAAALAISDWTTAARALNLRGLLQVRLKRIEDAVVAFQESRDLSRRANSVQGEVTALSSLGLIAARRGDNAEAKEWHTKAANLSKQVGDRRGLAIAAGNLGWIALEEKDLATAQAFMELFLAEGRAMRDTTRVAIGLVNLGDTLNRRGNLEAGVPHLAIAEAMLRRQRHPSLTEANRCLAEAESEYGVERLAVLRQELGRMSLPTLLLVDPARYMNRRLEVPVWPRASPSDILK